MSLLPSMKDVIDEDALVKGLAEKVVPALAEAARVLVREVVDSLVGLTVTVGKKKPEGP